MTQQQTATNATPSSPLPFHLSMMCHSLAEARKFYSDILGCPERRATATSAHFDLFGSQLTLHEVEGFNAKTLQRQVDAEDVPVPHFGGAVDESSFHAIANRLNEAGWSFILEPHKRFVDKGWEQWVLFILDPSGNAIELKSFTKVPIGHWA